MYRKCATEISAAHQRLVTESLLELMQKIPYDEITVTQLCQTAGISRRIFYHLFSNKTGALHALVDTRVLDIQSFGKEIPNETLRFFRYWKAQETFLDALAKNGKAGLLLERMIVSVLAEDYDIRYWLRHHGWENDSQEVIIYGLSGLIGLIYSWYYSGYRKSPEEMAAMVDRIARPASD